MTQIPGVRDGRKCVFRVVRVSGTIRKAQEEAVRRARELILAAQRDLSEKSESSLSGIFNKTVEREDEGKSDAMMVDRSDSEEDEAIGG